MLPACVINVCSPSFFFFVLVSCNSLLCSLSSRVTNLCWMDDGVGRAPVILCSYDCGRKSGFSANAMLWFQIIRTTTGAHPSRIARFRIRPRALPTDHGVKSRVVCDDVCLENYPAAAVRRLLRPPPRPPRLPGCHPPRHFDVAPDSNESELKVSTVLLLRP